LHDGHLPDTAALGASARLYLVTFILAFARRPPERLEGASFLLFRLLILPILFMLSLNLKWPLMMTLLLHGTAFFAGAYICQSRLALLRPGTSHLTEFYFWISAGARRGTL